jgi:hypothetical protein
LIKRTYLRERVTTSLSQTNLQPSVDLQKSIDTKFIMTSPSAQAAAQALNAKLENEARTVIDELERNYLRKTARKAYACVVTCYDKAGTAGSADALENCARQCQVPHQQGNAYVQNVRIFVSVVMKRGISLLYQHRPDQTLLSSFPGRF